VEPVGEVERQRGRDDDDEDDVGRTSGVLDDDALEDVRDALARVDRASSARRCPSSGSRPSGRSRRRTATRSPRGDPVAVVLQAVDLDHEVADVAEPRSGHRLGDLARALQQDVGQALGLSIGASIL
jgi:hypothetical protein